MPSFVLDSPRLDDCRVSTILRIDGTEQELSFTASRPISPAVGDVLLCSTLLPAMAFGGDLHIPAVVSSELLANVEEIQRIFLSWLPDLKPVHVQPDEVVPDRPRAPGVASFFSGGVDSSYTVLSNLDRIDTLIFLRGFDIPPDKPHLSTVATERIRAVAAELGKDFVEVDIAGRGFTGPLVPWEFYFGALLAAVAHLWAGRIGTVLLPASLALREPAPCGSHPLTDHLWGSSAVHIVHDGAEADRAEKIRYLADFDIAMRNLRVCWENPEEEYNCGRCRKCLMTMAGLQAADALGRCTTLPAHLDTAELQKIEIADEFILALAEYYLRAIENAPDRDPTGSLTAALHDMIGDYRRRQAEQHLGPLEAARPKTPWFARRWLGAAYRRITNVTRSCTRRGRRPQDRTTLG